MLSRYYRPRPSVTERKTMTAKTTPFASTDSASSSGVGLGGPGEPLRGPVATLLPYDVVLDKRLAADELAALTLLATYQGISSAEAVLVLREYLRMGEERASRVRRKLRHLGYIRRSQERIAGRFGPAQEMVTFEPAPHFLSGSRLFCRSRPGGKLSASANGVYVYLYSFSGQLFQYRSDQPTLCLQRPDGAKVCARVGGDRLRR